MGGPGRVRSLTPRVTCRLERKKKKTGRAKMRFKFNRQKMTPVLPSGVFEIDFLLVEDIKEKHKKERYRKERFRNAFPSETVFRKMCAMEALEEKNARRIRELGYEINGSLETATRVEFGKCL